MSSSGTRKGSPLAGRRAVEMVLLMLLMSISPILTVPTASAHAEPSGVSWPLEGSNDTGWIMLNAVGADAASGQQASALWNLSFAPGADLSNVTLEVRASGQAGMTIEEPLLAVDGLGVNLLDWRGLGVLGEAEGFASGPTYSGRMSPNSNSGAGWDLPSSAIITDLIIQTLAPVDPAVSLRPIPTVLHDTAVHPDTGVLFLAMNDDLMMLHASTDPHVLDMIDLSAYEGAHDLVIDTTNGLLHVLAGDGSLHAFSLLNLSTQSPVGAPTNALDAMMMSSTGVVYGANSGGLLMFDGTSWSTVSATGDSFSGPALALHETAGVVYAAIEGAGVLRYDVAAGQAMTAWSTANVLHSDSVHTFLNVGNQLLLGSQDNGIGRYNHNAGFWLSTWNDGNWLDDNRIAGMAAVGNEVLIANGPSVHIYNTTMGVFDTTIALDDLGLVNDAEFAFAWPSTGAAAPTLDTVMVSDGSGLLAKLTPQGNAMHQGNLLLSSGPATDDMQAVLELNGVVYIGTMDGTGVMRYDTINAVWLTPWNLGGQGVMVLATDGADLFVGTNNASSVEQWSTSGNLLATITGQNCYPSTAEIISMDVDATSAFMSLSSGTVVHVDRATGTCTATASGDLPTPDIGDVALHNGVGYVASEDEGVLRYDVANDTWLTPWISTGVNGVSFAPVAIVGDELFLGLPGYGVARKNLVTGEILAPFTSEGRNPQLPSNQIYALESDGANLYIGTQQGARKWDGAQFTSFGQGSSWQTRPSQFFDFAVESSNGDLYAGTNIGLCKYALNTMAVEDCQNVYDGMPNWATYAVGTNANYVFGGTNTGVGVIDKSNFQHDFNWGETSQTGNAVVEIIDDIAYIGTDGLGVLRYNLTSGEWLSAFSEGNGQLDAGNDDITGLVADVRPGHLWIGGNDGFQLLNISTGAEVYDIETNSNLYDASGSPYQMTIHNDIMYYHSSTNSDEVGRLDVVNFSNPGALDVGTELSENNGDVYSMHLRGDHLFVSLSSGQWWDADGSGGIAVWNTSSSTFESSLLPTGSIDRVTAFTSSNGNTWVAWGELRLDLYAPNGSLTGSWDTFDLPIRGIVEFDGHTLMAANDEILRYNESSNQWATSWTEGNGLPNDAGDQYLDLWTDGANLVIGGAQLQSWGGFIEGVISHLDGTGAWTTYEANSDNDVPNGYPIAMVECGGLLNIAMYNNNGGVARLDVQNQTMTTAFERFDLDGNQPASVACDASQTLYVGYYQDNQPISKYSYATSAWLTSLTQTSHNLPADRIWYDGLAHANGQLIIGHGIGFGGSAIGGGYSLLASNGASSGQAAVFGAGSSVTSLQWMGANTGWMIGQAGGTSGYSHVSTLSSLGTQKVVDLPGLVSGQVTAMASNATHIWAATGVLTGGGSTGNFGTAAGLLQGTFLPNGTVDWDYGWTLTANSVANNMHLDGTDLYITTNPSGLMVLDTTTNVVSMMNGALHNKMDTMMVEGTELIIGLAGDDGSPPGVQRFDMNTQQFSGGRLIGGLPSSVINGFTETANILYIATDGGIGRWNYSQADWMDSITAANGLPSNIVEDILAVGSTVYMATPQGLVAWDESSGTASTVTTNSGLLGNSVWGLATINAGGANPMLVLSHDGRGVERPGASLVSLSSNAVDSTHRFDQLPSNTVTALASDWWGVHVATDFGSLTHWNSSSGEFEDGNIAMQTQPTVTAMVSDGNELLAMTEQQNALLLEARTESHAVLSTFRPGGIVDGTLGTNHLWITTDDGLFGWSNNGQYTPVEEYTMRRAHPLTVRTLGNSGGLNITDMTHPGVSIGLVDPDDPYALDENQGTAGVHGLLFQNVPLVFTSPVNGAAVWALSERLLYDVALDISDDPALGMNLQSAVDVAPLYDNTRHVTLRLLSPSNGSLEARITYDFVRSDTPVVMEDLSDRPDDGGGALMASWSLVHDEDFARYVVFVNEGPWLTPPTEALLMERTPDKTVSVHSRLSAEVQTANGVPLQDGVEYHAVIVVEYNDGRWGEISPSLGPAMSSDELPRPPAWALATPADGDDNDGDLALEWARCTALDLASTNLYVSTTPFNDAFGLTPKATYQPNQGNMSTVTLTPGLPVWIGWTCVDLSGQENLSDVTVVGPIVPTGELNDNEAPDPIEGTRALDVPEDEGGMINVEWNASTADDCAFYTVFMTPWDQANQNDPSVSISEPSSVETFSQAAVVNDCETTSVMLNRLDGVPLTDGRSYAVGVVAYDAWLNGNIDEVTLVLATPMQNIIGQGATPERITTLLAFDHPEDDGTAIDVVWEPSQVDDFASYTVWIADQPVTDLSTLYALTGTDDNTCGCFSFNKQWIDEETNPIQLTLSTALYTDGGALTDGVPGLIQPDIELYIAVTVHDLRGNVHLTELTQATVTPVNNLNDETAPERLSAVRLVDRPNDNGQALLLDFDLSEAGDVAAYEVYAATYNFNGEVTASLTPVTTLGRNPSFPVVIDLVAGDTPVVPGQEIWAAVVVIDSSSNRHNDMLTMVSAEATNEGITDPGVNLPDIANVEASWFEEVSVLVEWDHSIDARVRGYQVYIHDEMFEDTGVASLVGEVRASNSYLITSEVFDELDNGSAWYIAVVPFDETVSKTTVEAMMLSSLNGENPASETNEESDGLQLESLLTGPNLVAAGMVIIVLLLLVLVARSRGGGTKRNKNWELQEATWGIETPSWDAPQTMPAPSPPPAVSPQQANDIYAAAERITNPEYGQATYQAPQPVVQPQVDMDLLDGLVEKPQSSSQPHIDTSFLDDLL